MAVFLGPRQITASERDRRRKPRDMHRREPCLMVLSVVVVVVEESGCEEVVDALGVLLLMVEG